jgi:hypothetical protein
MGVDWFRATVKPGVDRSRLEQLVEQQAVAFQSMYGWNSVACQDADGVRNALLGKLHAGMYRSASDAIRELLDFPGWDRSEGCAEDIPDLIPCCRVNPITNNVTFPPLWRMRAHRTILAERLGDQLAQWQAWAEQVAQGDHDEYIRELHMHVSSDWMKYHWSCLREAATASLSPSGEWAKKPELVEVREQILRLPEPFVFMPRIDPEETAHEADDNARYEALFAEIRRLIDLTRAWNYNVKKHRAIKYYESCYHMSLDDFRDQARDAWLQDFFLWAERCAASGFALYLDY